MPSDEEIEVVRGLVDACHRMLDQLEPNERTELMRHIETIREARQSVSAATPLTLMMRVSNPDPSVFPLGDAQMRKVL